jgi:hypothetical protein
VISFQTVCISLFPKTASHIESENAQIIIIQKGTPIFQMTSQECFTASLIAASGQIALATSFAQCAKLKSATAKIRGILKSLLMNLVLSTKNPSSRFL